ncbi:TMAO reductase system periplasmic protein TorT [Actibacterium sp.]|uniref:TMAO reductase system periplasmic protein TorT n=1 Tax=Actibacterium sp. TaxID=1872125 RepID=UPI00257A7F51|nr:TMAO reductase system periplasmic protein TorT [Actibacterium sp.]|tara:strand:+ start:11877 stop:12944 length:1068 start_codon:yes stop_codon:yes gene_type:complete
MRIGKYLATTAVALTFAGHGAWADEDTWSAPLLAEGDLTAETYTPLPVGAVSKPWHLCVSFPHMKDAYYVAKDYGVVVEAQRQGVSATIMSAGGYANVLQQIQQLEDCVSRGGDAVLVNAVSKTGLVAMVEEMAAKGIPVIDLGNGLETDKVAGRARAGYYNAGAQAGAYLASKHPAGSGKVEMVWMAGPAGSQWVEDAVAGMKDSIAGSDVELVKVMYGDTGKGVQMRLIDDALQTYEGLDIIGGVAPAIEGGVEIIKAKGLEHIDLIAFYSTPAMEQGVRDGDVMATVGDYNLVGSRISVDQAIRALEGKLEIEVANRAFFIVDQDNVNTYDRTTILAPDGFEPVFEVKAPTN